MTEQELNVLLNAITTTGYKITNLLNTHLDSDSIPDWQAEKLRTAAAYVSQANSAVYDLIKRMEAAGWWDEK